MLDRADSMVVGLHRIWADMTLLVRGVMQHADYGMALDYTQIQPIADRIDTLLHDHEEVTASLAVHSFSEESYSDETLEGGKPYMHAGGIFRLRARAV